MSERVESLNTQFVDAVTAIVNAQDYLDRMCAVTAAARSDEAAARNRLNAAQARFDGLVKKIKDGAPQNTTWNTPGPGFAVASFNHDTARSSAG